MTISNVRMNDRGQFHCDDGPAIEYGDGYKSYWIDGLRHRIDGPAIEWPDGSVEYYLNGKPVNEADLPGTARRDR